MRELALHVYRTRPFRYLVTGASGYVVNLLAFWGGIALGLSPYASLFPAYVINTTWNFLLNRYWTFGAGERNAGGDVSRFMVVALILLGWNYATFHIFYGVLEMPEIAAQTLSVICGLPVGYAMSHFWAFANRDPQGHADDARS